MTAEAIFLLAAALAMVPLAWLVHFTQPQGRTEDAVACFSLAALAVLSPLSALALTAMSVATPIIMTLGERMGRRGALGALWAAILTGALFFTGRASGVLWIGVAYFTLRHLHVLFEWWMGRMANPGIRRHLRYQLFLPVLMAGPIHRMANFERQCARRRWDAADLFSGAERVLFGVAQAAILGNVAMRYVKAGASALVAPWPTFLGDWQSSALDWVQLYFIFAGLTSAALGLSLMLGLRLEENFNRPWAARNLVGFWTRWHMTLSHWCRDYVFQPVTALTRSPLIGLVAAMIAIGLWHEASLYYLLWAVWQALGIVLSRLVARALGHGVPGRLRARLPAIAGVIGAPVLILAWLSLARPVVTRLLEVIGA